MHHIWRGRSTLSLSLAQRAASFVFLAVVLVIPFSASAALYAPGETLDPACAPTDPSCGISSVVGTGTTGQIPYYGANGGILTATSSITILSNGNVGIGTTTPYAKFSVDGPIVASYLNATSSTATSTFGGNVDISGLTRFTRTAPIMLDYQENTLGDFYITHQSFPAVNTDGSNNHVTRLGYNVQPNGATLDASIPSLSIAMESRWLIGGVPGTEFIVAHRALDGQEYRPIGFWMSQNNDDIVGSMRVKDFTMTGKGGTDFLTINTSNTGTFVASLFFSSGTTLYNQGNNSQWLKQRNSANSAYNTLLWLDNQDRVNIPDALAVVGPSATSSNIHASFQNTTAVSGGVGLSVNHSPSVTGTYSLAQFVADASTGGDVLVANNNTTNTANSLIGTRVTSAGGDAIFRSFINGGQAWTFGLDNSDSDKFKISSGNTLGTNDFYTLDTTGSSNFGGNVGVGTSTPWGRLSVAATADPNEHFTVLKATTGGYQAGLYYQTDARVLFTNNAYNDFGSTYAPSNGNGGIRLGQGGGYGYIVGAASNLLLNPAAGNVGIGTTTPSAKLAVTQSANTPAGGLWLSASNNTDFRSMYMDTSGILSFNGGDTAGTLNTATLNAAGAWTNASDRSYKEDIEDVPYGLETLMQMQPRSYNMKGTHLPQVGFIAQELKPLVPEVVDGKDGTMGISYGNLVTVVVKAVQELANKVSSFADSFTTKRLCLDDVCITKNELQNLLDEANEPSVSAPQVPDDSMPPTDDEDIEESLVDEPVVEEPTPDPVEEESTGEPEEQTEEGPSDDSAPTE